MNAPTPEERLAAFRARFATQTAPAGPRVLRLDAEDLLILGQLPQTPPDEKDVRLVELRERLRRGRAGALAAGR